MRARIGDQIVELEGSMLDNVINDMRDDRAGIAGLFFAAFLGSGEQSEQIEIIE